MISEIVAVLCLGYGSYKDIRTREIPDFPWLLMGVAGVALRFSDHEWKALIMSAGVAVVLGIILAISGLFGGADVKALAALSLLIPQYPGNVFPLFILSVFNNLAVLRIIEILAVFTYNTIKRNRYKGDIPVYKKILLYMTGFPLSKERLDYRFLPLQDSHGEVHLLPDIDMDIGKFKEECTFKEIWVTYGSPLIVYLLVACIIALIWGDILLQAIIIFVN
ncbi:MAG: prepilin peptidase [Theionarchaea archaeon]|nr:prepilin peptidase [Theionarchaea archaeon]